MPDVIITPISGSIDFVKDGAQSPATYRLSLSADSGLILNAPLTSSFGVKAPNILDTSGNNTFTGTTTFSGPTVINGDLSVYGTTNVFSASNVYITSSTLIVTDNILTLNALPPYQRYAGIEMFDTGSGTKSQFLWDGLSDYFFLSGSGVNGKLITGPDGQTDLSSNYIPKATAGYKLGNSVMYDDGTRVGIGTTAPSGSLTIQSNGNQLRLQTASGPGAYYATIDALYNSTHPFQIAVAGNSVNTAEYFGIYADAGGSNPRIALLNGNVGVGLTNPSAKFHVTSSTNADEVLIGTIGNDQLVGGRTNGSFGIATKSTSNGNLILTSGDALYIRTSGSNDRVIVKNDGNVGIGTTNPLTKLTSYVGSGAISSTNDAIRLQVASYNNGGRNTIVWAQDSGNFVLGRYGLEWNSSTSQMNFVWRDVYNNGVTSTELMRLTGGGNLGIGTTLPNSKLNVNSSGSLAAGSVVFRVEGTSGSLFSVDDSLSGSLMSVNDISGLPILEVFSDDRVVMGTFNANTLVVTGSRVGIGTSSPAYKLDVNGVTRFQDVVRFKNAAWNLSDDGQVRFFFDVSGRTYFGSGNGYEWRSAADSAMMVLTNTGNVGIGTNNPSAKLQISSGDNSDVQLLVGQGSSYGAPSIRFKTASTNYMGLGFTTGSAVGNEILDAIAIQRTGNVGIGSTNPQYKLDVSGSIGLSGLRFVDLSGNYFRIYEPAGGNAIYLGNAGDPNNYYDNTGHYFRNRGGSSIYAYINSGGNLGIGTTTITARVHIKGGNEHIEGTVSGSAVIDSGLYAMQIGPAQTRTTSAGTYYPGIAFNHLLNFSSTTYNGAPQAWIGTRLQDSAGSERDYLVFATKPGTGTSGTGNDIPLERMCIDYAGNVGIGTTSPNTKFEVAGYAMAGSGVYRTSIYGDNGGAYIYFGTPASVSSLGTIGAYGALFNINSLNNDISFQYNSSEKMRVTTGGHLGLGITNPTAYVNSNGNWFRPSLDGLYSSIYATTEAVVNLISSGSADGAAVGGVYFTRARAQGDAHYQIAAIRAIQSGTSNTIAGGSLQFFTKANGGGTTATTPQMVIWNDGNVGIGTATPSNPLHIYTGANEPILVQGTTGGSWINFKSSTSNLLSVGADGTLGLGFYNRTTSTYLAVINNTGNLGVGTSSPGATLDLWASAARIKFRRTSSYDMSFGIHDSSTSALSIKNSGDASTIAYFQYDGNVGIGTTAFAYASSNRGNVEIYGSTDALIGLRNATANSYLQKSGNDFYLNNGGAGFISITTNASERMRITSGGLVGIGTTTVNEQLDVYRANTGGWNPRIVARDGTNAAFIGVYNGQPGVYAHNNALNAWADLYLNTTSPTNPVTSGKVFIGGNVGIGTTSPSASLHVSSTTAGATLIRADGTNGTLFSVVDDLSDSLLSVNNSAGLPVFEVFADDRVVAGQYGQNDFVVRNNFVGIGTNNPTAKLYVTSSTSTPSAVFLGGSVGIGTSSPGAKLVVIGETQISSNAAYTTHFNYQDSGINFISTANGGYTDFRASSNNITTMRVKGDGTVGIGTTSPGTTLEVYAIPASTTTLRQMLIINTDYASASGTGFGGSIVFRGRTAGNLLRDNAQISAYNEDIGDNGYALGFYTRPSDGGGLQQRLTILRGGNVGIGTTSPTAKLQIGTNSISGTTNNSGNVRIGQSNAAGAMYGLALANTATATVNNESALSFIVAGDYSATGIISTVLRNTSTAASDLVFTNYNNGLNERMRIQYDGNVGIGTTAPLFNLSVNSTFNAGGPFVNSANTNVSTYYDQVVGAYNHTPGGMIRLDSATTSSTNAPATFVLYNKNGTDNTATKLVFANNETSATNANPVATAAITSQKVSGTAGNWASGNLKFLVKNGQNYVDAATFDNVGNFGIGTGSPSYKLHVVGDIYANGGWLRVSGTSGLYFETYGGGWVMNDTTWIRTYQSKNIWSGTGLIGSDGGLTVGYGGASPTSLGAIISGSVGIGTSSPAVKLHVVGSSILSNNTQINPDSYQGSIVAGAIADGSGWGVVGSIGGNGGAAGKSWGIGNSGTDLYFGYQNASANSTMQTFMQVSSARNLYLVPVSGNVGIGTTVVNARVESYYSSNAITFNYLATNLNNSSPIPVYGFDVTNGVGETRSIKAGIGYERHLTNGRGTMHFYNDSTNDTASLAGNRTTAGDIKMSLDNSGNLGIGTTQPSWLLTVYAASAPQFTLQNGTRSFILTNNAGDNLLSFNYGGVNRLQFDTTNQWFNTGNVGVGSVVPAYKLDVNGSFRTVTGNLTIFNDNIYVSPTNSNTLNSGYGANSVTDMWINFRGYADGQTQFRNFNVGDGKGSNIAWFDGTNKRLSINNGQAADYTLQVMGTGYFSGILRVNSNLTVAGGGDVIIYDSDGTGAFNSFMDNGVGYIRIDDGGTANGSLNINSGLLFVGAAGGNVGIGTSSPTALLTVYNSSTPTINFDTGTATSRGKISATASDFTIAALTSSPLIFKIDTGEKVRIQSDGNVGIGTTAPGQKLDVEGRIRTRGATGTGGFEIGAATTGTAKWRIEWDSASDSLDFNWVG